MPKAFICGCAGVALNDEERAFLRGHDPWGLILFKRNVADREQLRALTRSFRDCVGRADAPVLIDQEGGRVQRMAPPHWRVVPGGRRDRGRARAIQGRGRGRSRRAPDRS